MKHKIVHNKPIAILDLYTKKEVARFPNVITVAKEFGLTLSTLYSAICMKRPVYSCYWVYVRDLESFVPDRTSFIRTKNLRIPEKLEKFLMNLGYGER